MLVGTVPFPMPSSGSVSRNPGGRFGSGPGAEALVLEDWDPRNVRNHEDSDDTCLGNRLAVVSSDQVILLSV